MSRPATDPRRIDAIEVELRRNADALAEQHVLLRNLQQEVRAVFGSASIADGQARSEVPGLGAAGAMCGHIDRGLTQSHRPDPSALRLACVVELLSGVYGPRFEAAVDLLVGLTEAQRKAILPSIVSRLTKA